MCASARAGGCAIGLLWLFVFGVGQGNAQQGAARGNPEHGRELFERVWQPGTTLQGGDGLGPMYNERSCVACHFLGGIGGAGPNKNNVDILSVALPKEPKAVDALLQRLPSIHTAFAAGPSIVLHRFSSTTGYLEFREGILGLTSLDAEPAQQAFALPAQQAITWSAIHAQQADRPIKKIRGSKSNHGIPMLLSGRNTTPMFGAGDIDRITDSDILGVFDAQAHENRKLIGRFVGRFGWRGQVSHLAMFVRGACAVELGLSARSSAQSPDPLKPPGGQTSGFDVTDAECADLTAFIAKLPRPRRLPPIDAAQANSIHLGEGLFESIGCAFCHRPTLGSVQEIYSDLLVHDLGPKLEDPFAAPVLAARDLEGYYGQAVPAVQAAPSPLSIKHRREWKTPPLWGLRDSGPYLHDGRAATIEEAILWHGGDATTSVDKYRGLSALQRSWMLTFLSTLAAPDAAELDRLARAEH